MIAVNHGILLTRIRFILLVHVNTCDCRTSNYKWESPGFLHSHQHSFGLLGGIHGSCFLSQPSLLWDHLLAMPQFPKAAWSFSSLPLKSTVELFPTVECPWASLLRPPPPPPILAWARPRRSLFQSHPTCWDCLCPFYVETLIPVVIVCGGGATGRSLGHEDGAPWWD